MKPHHSPSSSQGAPAAATSRSNQAAEKAPFGIQTILVPTDFSDAGKSALKYANSFAHLVNAKVCLLHVIEWPYRSSERSLTHPDPSVVREHATRELGALQVTEFPQIRTDFEVCEGIPFREIVGAASKEKADLILLATHGYTGLRHLVMGSTAERVVRHAECPVLVIPSVPSE